MRRGDGSDVGAESGLGGGAGAARGRRDWWLVWVLAALLSVPGQVAAAEATSQAGAEPVDAAAHLGLWVAENGAVWHVEEHRATVAEAASDGQGAPEVTAIWETRPGLLLVNGDDGLTWWSVDDTEEGIVLRRPDGDVALSPAPPDTRMPEIVPLEIQPVRQGLQPSRIEALQAELKERHATDQRLIKAAMPDPSDQQKAEIRQAGAPVGGPGAAAGALSPPHGRGPSSGK